VLKNNQEKKINLLAQYRTLAKPLLSIEP